MPDVTILDIRKVQANSPDRRGKDDIFALYTIDKAKVAAIRVPAEGFTEQKLQDAIKRELAEHHSLTGKTFKL